jgi:hypothetical protein
MFGQILADPCEESFCDSKSSFEIHTAVNLVGREIIFLQLVLPFKPPSIFTWSSSFLGEIFIAVAIGQELECLFKWIGLCHHPLERGIELFCWHSGVFVKEKFTLSNAVASG